MQPQQKYFLGNHLERKLRFKVESARENCVSRLNPPNDVFGLCSMSVKENAFQQKETITVYCDYKEDGRHSMDVYADNLISEMQVACDQVERVVQLRPTIPHLLGFVGKVSPGLMIRLARYVLYPMMVYSNKRSGGHFIDQSYAHLLLFFKNKSVITVHDIIPLLAWKGKIPGMRYPHYPLLYKVAMFSLRKAGHIIAVSQSTKNDLIEYCGIDERSISVVYNGISEIYKKKEEIDAVEARKRLSLPGKKSYIVMISGAQAYKNHYVSFQVINRVVKIVDKPLHIVWLGGNAELLSEIDASEKVNCDVTYMAGLSSDELRELYKVVDCLLFPSLYEGFGLPPLEAMACGTPVVTSNVASLIEVVGDAAITLSPYDVQGLAEGVASVLADESVRNHYIQRGYDNAEKFSWEKCAERTCRVYRRYL